MRRFMNNKILFQPKNIFNLKGIGFGFLKFTKPNCIFQIRNGLSTQYVRQTQHRRTKIGKIWSFRVSVPKPNKFISYTSEEAVCSKEKTIPDHIRKAILRAWRTVKTQYRF